MAGAAMSVTALMIIAVGFLVLALLDSLAAALEGT